MRVPGRAPAWAQGLPPAHPQSSSDAYTSAYVAAVIASGTTVSPSKIAALNTFFSKARLNGWGLKAKRTYALTWGNQSANRINLWDPTKLAVYVGTVTPATGYQQSDGTTGVMQADGNFSGFMSAEDFHIAARCCDDSIANTHISSGYPGAATGTVYLGASGFNNSLYGVGCSYLLREVSTVALAANVTQGVFSMRGIVGTTTIHMHKNGITLDQGTNSNVTAGSPTPLTATLHARNSSSVMNLWTTQRLSGWSMGQAFIDQAAHNAYMLAFETLLLALGAPAVL